MDKASKCRVLALLISFCFIGWTGNVMAASQTSSALEQPAETSQDFVGNQQNLGSVTMPSTPDILSDVHSDSSADMNDTDEQSLENGTENMAGDGSDNDSANDYDSNKESESEDAAPTPQEEGDNPLLDEEGNITGQEQMQPNQILNQNPLGDQSQAQPAPQATTPAQPVPNLANPEVEG